MSLVIDHFDLERKLNDVLTFAVNCCTRKDCLDIALKNETPREQIDISIRWGIPKGSADWDEQKCLEFGKDQLRQLESYLMKEFGLEHNQTTIDNDTIWVYCRIFTAFAADTTASTAHPDLG